MRAAPFALFFSLALTIGCAASNQDEQALRAFSRGETAFGNGDFQAALKYYRQAQRDAPDDPTIRTRIAEFDFYENHTDQAQSALSAIVEDYPHDRRARTSLNAVRVRVAAFGADRNSVSMAPIVNVPMIEQARVPIVLLKLNGHYGHFIVATGVATTVLSKGFANLLGIHSATAKIESLQFAHGDGSFGMRNADVVVAPFNVMNGRSRRIVAGVLGASFFSHVLATLDFRRNQLIVRPSTTTSSGSVSIPFLWFPRVPAVVQGKINGVPALCVFDSSFPYDFDAPDFLLKRARISLADYMVANSISIGPITKRHAVGSHSRRNMPQGVPIAVFGRGLLDRYAVTIDFRSMRLLLSR